MDKDTKAQLAETHRKLYDAGRTLRTLGTQMDPNVFLVLDDLRVALYNLYAVVDTLTKED
jgi:hypothetical protein